MLKYCLITLVQIGGTFTHGNCLFVCIAGLLAVSCGAETYINEMGDGQSNSSLPLMQEGVDVSAETNISGLLPTSTMVLEEIVADGGTNTSSTESEASNGSSGNLRNRHIGTVTELRNGT